MSISIQDFSKGNFKTRYQKKEHPILVFLKQNKSKAFRVDEIVKALKINEDSCRGMLQKFVKQKLVLHKVPYFVINNNQN